jgi:hypothetical protein
MESLSKKAKVVYAAFEMLNAKGLENKVNAYTILDFISENEELQDHDLIKDMDEQDFVDIIMDLNIKSVNTIIASLCRKGIVEKTEPTSIKIDGQRRNLRQYFLK